MEKNGYIRFKLEEQISKAGLSKSKLCFRAEMQRTQLNKYCKNEISRIDLPVLARICKSLNCNIEDIMEYVPQDNE